MDMLPGEVPRRFPSIQYPQEDQHKNLEYKGEDIIMASKWGYKIFTNTWVDVIMAYRWGEEILFYRWENEIIAHKRRNEMLCKTRCTLPRGS